MSHDKLVWCRKSVIKLRCKAKKKELPFDLDAEYLYQKSPSECPVFSTPFVYNQKKQADNMSPSVDRLEPHKGYVKGNIAVISMKANKIKSSAISAEIFRVAIWLQGLG
jgi:hypothetical protein